MKHDEVLKFTKVCIARSHEVDDGHNLARKGQRIVLGEPKTSLQLLDLCDLLQRPTDVLAIEVKAVVKVFIGSDGARVVTDGRKMTLFKEEEEELMQFVLALYKTKSIS